MTRADADEMRHKMCCFHPRCVSDEDTEDTGGVLAVNGYEWYLKASCGWLPSLLGWVVAARAVPLSAFCAIFGGESEKMTLGPFFEC